MTSSTGQVVTVDVATSVDEKTDTTYHEVLNPEALPEEFQVKGSMSVRWKDQYARIVRSKDTQRVWLFPVNYSKEEIMF